MAEKKIFIRGMHCRSCEILLEDALRAVPNVTSVSVDHRAGTALLGYGASAPSGREIERTVRANGYAVTTEREHLPFVTSDLGTYVHLIFAFGIAFVLYVLATRLHWFGFSLGAGTADASHLGFVALIGLTAGVSTCAALIGGLVLGASARYGALHPDLAFGKKLAPQLWFHTGRVLGFGVFGALLGFFGSRLEASIGLTATLTLLAGLVMLFLGIELTGLFPRLDRTFFTLPKGIARVLGLDTGRARTYSHGGTFLLGALTFFLPCGFTQAMQLAAMATGSALAGALILSVFALGTVPGLLALGGLGTAASGNVKRFSFSLIGVFLVAFGVSNVSNGLRLFGFGLPAPSGSSEAALAPSDGRVQEVRITQDASGYHPDALPALAVGVPTRLIIDSQNSFSCASSFVIPEFGIQKRLTPGENVIEFVPTRKGTIAFSCSMGMYRGALTVN